MPGHRVARSNVKNPDVFEKYQCPHCKLLLKDAVQPVCGHWLCESCADELLESLSSKCPRADCQEDLRADADEGAEYFPDRFVRREIEGLIVSCSTRPEGCQWEDRLVKLDDHQNICSFFILGCQCCGEVSSVDQMESHKLTCPKVLMKCPLAEFGCQLTQQITREELRKHIVIHSLEDFKMLADTLQLLKKQTMHHIKPIILQADDDSNATGHDFGRMSDGIERDCAVPKVVKSREFRAVLPDIRRITTDGLERDYAGEKKAYQAVFADGPGVTTDASTYGGLPDRNALEVHAATTFRNAATMNNSVLEAKLNSEIKRKDEEIATLRNSMTKLMTNLEKVMLDFRPSLIENNNHDGSMSPQDFMGILNFELQSPVQSSDHFATEIERQAHNICLGSEELTNGKNGVRNKEKKVATLKETLQSQSESEVLTTERIATNGKYLYKLSGISLKMLDAREGKHLTQHSLPFYMHGYKLCLEVYFIGDGIGKNTHMSLFFVIMKGDYDDILRWPFTYEVTFKLINQRGNMDIIDTFQPDPMSSSFQKPTSDMNIASGCCPRFVSHTELDAFIADDMVRIEISLSN